jgi:hypothetical protein
MAIKGKGRSKRRGVAAAPKPVYVQAKRPILARRWFQIGALVVIVVGTAVGVTLGLRAEHQSSQRKALTAKETTIVDRFGHLVDSDLAGVGQPFQTQFQPFPELTADVAKLKSGQLSGPDAVKEGRKWSKAATDAQTSIEQIQTAQMIQGHADLIDLSNAQSLIGDGLAVYQQAADALRLTGRATGAQQKALLRHTGSLLAVAARVFNDGYQKLINQRQRFNLLAPVTPTQPSTLPTSIPVPSVVPSAPTPSGGAHKHKHKKK